MSTARRGADWYINLLPMGSRYPAEFETSCIRTPPTDAFIVDAFYSTAIRCALIMTTCKTFFQVTVITISKNLLTTVLLVAWKFDIVPDNVYRRTTNSYRLCINNNEVCCISIWAMHPMRQDSRTATKYSNVVCTAPCTTLHCFIITY